MRDVAAPRFDLAICRSKQTGLEKTGAPRSLDSIRFTEDAMATVLAPAEETSELWSRYHADSQNRELRNQLVERYFPLVKFHGERLWSRLPEGVELDDLISAGVFGLMDAIDAFDPGRGVRFETYCVTRIRGAMLDELRSMDWVPRLVRSKAARLNEATKQLENKLGRAPTDGELTTQLQISQEELDQMKLEATTVNLVSLDKKFADDDSNRAVSELDVLDDRRSEDPTRRAQKNDLLRLVTRGLNRVERLILILYYYEEMTMKEVGATLDLSESRVSQMHSSLMQRLQEQLAPRRPELAAE